MGSVNGNGLTGKAWLRALELTAPIPRNHDRVMSTVIEELAASRGDAPAPLSDRECMTYRELSARVNQYARWALDAGIAKDEVVCLLMPNRPEYLAIWLGITSVGGVVSLLNTNLPGPSLAHCMIEHQACMGHVLREALKASGWRIVNSTPFPLVCFTRKGLKPAKFLASLHQRQIAWMSEARIGGDPVVRACITSFETSDADIHWVVKEMNRLIE